MVPRPCGLESDASCLFGRPQDPIEQAFMGGSWLHELCSGEQEGRSFDWSFASWDYSGYGTLSESIHSGLGTYGVQQRLSLLLWRHSQA